MAIALGIAVEVLFYGHPPGISFFLWAALCVIAAVAAARLEAVRTSGSAWLAMAGVLVFAAATFFRQEPLTVFLCVVLTFLLLTIVVRAFRFGRLARYGWIDMAIAFIWVPIEAWIRPWPVANQAWSRTVQERGGRKVLFSVLRGLILAVPFLVVFIALLSAADLIFGSFVQRVLSWIDLPNLLDWTGRLAVVIFSASFLLGALAAAVRPADDRRLVGEDPPLVPPFLGFTETTIVLTLVILVFGSFVAVQFAYLFGGQANIVAAGYTYAEYARRGFMELVTVAILALGMIALLAAVTRIETPRRRRWFLALSTILVLLVGVMLVSAYQRLTLYEQAYGFSRLRTYTHVAIGWLAVSFAVFLVLLFLRRMRLLAPAALALACGFVLSLVLVNVDAFIADRNAVRFAASGEIDVPYLASLTDDAVPRLVTLASGAGGDVRTDLLADLSCRRHALTRAVRRLDWPSAHASRQAALASLATIAADLDAYPVYLDARGIGNRYPATYLVDTPHGLVPCPIPGPD
jgi:hypothetical protein